LKPVVQLFSKGFALIPQPLLPYMGEEEPEFIWEKRSENFKVPLPDLGEGFRVRAKTRVLNLDEV
jgi:hypothetical protein